MSMAEYVVPFATDEDVVIREVTDFVLICPRDQMVASGSDGLLQSVDRWILHSSSVDFAAQGVQPGQAVLLSGPVTHFRAPGELMFVEECGSGWVRMRRKGLGAGAGNPPGPPQGLSGVEFSVLTLAPQILAASEDIGRRLGIGNGEGGRLASDLEDLGELRDATVLTVLHRLCLAMARPMGDEPDVFALKAERLKVELDEVLARLVVHWKGMSDVTTRFHTRIGR